MAAKEVAKTFEAGLTEVPKGWKYDLPKSELSFSPEFRKAIIQDLPKTTPHLRAGLNPYHAFLGTYYFNAVRHETLKWAQGKDFKYSFWPWPTNERALCPPHPYSSMSLTQFLKETGQMRNM
jgi:hypothetical protein